MPCVLILRRAQRETNGVSRPPNRRGHVIAVKQGVAPLKSLRTRDLCAIIDLPDMNVLDARALFIAKDYVGGDQHGETIRQRSVRLDVDVLRPLIAAPKRPKLTHGFTVGETVTESDRFGVVFEILRRGFIVDGDPDGLEIKSDGTIGPK